MVRVLVHAWAGKYWPILTSTIGFLNLDSLIFFAIKLLLLFLNLIWFVMWSYLHKDLVLIEFIFSV